MLRKLLMSVAVFFLCASLSFAQSGTLTGTVTDASSGETIPGVNVLLMESQRGSATDAQGSFTIENIPYGTYQLRVTYVGYKEFTREVDIQSSEKSIDIELQPDVLGMEEVVVTGVGGETKREKTTFTVEQVGEEQLEKAPAVSAGASLTGKIAGVSVTPTSGAPGSGTSITLRGSGSISGSNQPLYIVDGVILSADAVDIDPQDIKNVEVVKGAAAASLYGSRAQNGIINITTKRGENLGLGNTQVTIRNEYGINQLQNNVDVNQSHWFQTNDQGEWLDGSGSVVGFDDAANDNFAPGVSFADNSYPGKTYDNIDRFFDPGNFYRNYISVAQNLEQTNFLASFSNTDEAGVIPGLDGYNRKSVRLNIDHKVSSDLSVKVSGNYVSSTADDADVGGMPDPFFGLLFQFPNQNLAADEDGDGLPDVRPTQRIQEENPLYGIKSEAGETTDRNRVLGSFNARYQPVDWFNIEGNLSYDNLNYKNVDYLPLGFQSIDAGTETGYYSRYNSSDEALNASVTASFIQEFGDLSTQTRFRALIENSTFESTTAIGNEFLTRGVKSLSATSPASQEVESFQSEIRSKGYFGITNLDYKDKYILDLMVRRDGSSLFGSDERWHTYYRVSGAYRVSQEPWWFAPDILNEFKLRYSLGTAGARPDFSAQYETFNVGAGSISKGTLGNPNLTPEFTTEQEYGVDVGILDQFFLQLTYATSEVEDQILNVPLPSYFGYSSQWQNAGTMETETYEASLDGTLLQTQDMSLNFGATFSMTDQKITEFNQPAYRTGPGDYQAFYYREGETFGAMYGTKWMTSLSELPSGVSRDAFDVNDDGYDVYVGAGNSYEDGISDNLWGTTGSLNGNSYKWGMPIADKTEDGSTFQKIGSVVPDFNLGFNTTFNYKGFSAYMVWDAQIGGDIYNATRQWPYRDNLSGDIDQQGKAEANKKPIQYYATLYNTNAVNSHFVEDGSYLKLRELSLDYTLGSETLSNLFGGGSAGSFLREVSFGVTGRNLVTITGYSGYDPDVLSDGFRIDNFSYPVYRTITGKLEFKF